MTYGAGDLCGGRTYLASLAKRAFAQCQARGPNTKCPTAAGNVRIRGRPDLAEPGSNLSECGAFATDFVAKSGLSLLARYVLRFLPRPKPRRRPGLFCLVVTSDNLHPTRNRRTRDDLDRIRRDSDCASSSVLASHRLFSPHDPYTARQTDGRGREATSGFGRQAPWPC